MKTIKEELQDTVDLDMDKRELGRICGNALAEIIRLENALEAERLEKEFVQSRLSRAFA
jgi:hypothetical protein